LYFNALGKRKSLNYYNKKNILQIKIIEDIYLVHRKNDFAEGS